jgi:NADPH2 dehydrogenase
MTSGYGTSNNVVHLRPSLPTFITLAGKLEFNLNHAGRKSEATFSANQSEIEAPSALPYDEDSRTPREMTTLDIQNTVLEFRQAAAFADQAGFDIIELHAAHGYLLNQFLSPLTNHRTNSYGGTLENRSRFLIEKVIEAVSEVWPD